MTEGCPNCGAPLRAGVVHSCAVRAGSIVRGALEADWTVVATPASLPDGREFVIFEVQAQRFIITKEDARMTAACLYNAARGDKRHES